MTVLPPIAGFPEADALVNVVTLYKGILYVAGNFTTIGGQARNGLAAIDVATRTVTAFDPLTVPGDGGSISALLALNDVLYIGSQNQMTFTGPVTRNYAAAVDLSGNLLPWAPEPNSAVTCLSFGPNPVAGPGIHPPLVYLGGQIGRAHV